MYLAPALFVCLLVWILPLVLTAGLALTDTKTGQSGVFTGHANLIRALTDPDFLGSCLSSLVFASGLTILNVGLGLALAVALMNNHKAKSMVQTALLLPWVLSELAVALIWSGFLDESAGFINVFLIRLGFGPLPFLTTSAGAMIALWLAATWRGLAFSAILQMAGLYSLPKNLIPAAKSDGAGKGMIFSKIIWPHQAKTLAINAVMVFLMAAVSFSLPFALTGGGPLHATEFVALKAYNTAFGGNFEMGYAAAQGIVILILYAIAAMALIRLRKAEL